MNGPSVEVQIRGGLGNQLFGLFAALSIGQILKRKPVLDLAGIDRSHTSGKFDVRSLKIEAAVSVKNTRPIEVKVRHLREIIIGKSNKFLFDDKSTNSFNELIRNLELEINRGTQLSQLTLRGFFQDFHFFNSVEYAMQRLDLRKPSRDFLLISEEIKDTEPIIAHIRLGDYLDHNIGILNEKYFENSIMSLKQSLGNREVWIFTNSPEQFRSIYPGISRQKFRVLGPSGDPAESMLLMSKAGGIVCSNSTFSFWAAKLSRLETKVIVPRNYSPHSEYQIRNIPAAWMQIENSWI